jgi:hypothetical protein
VELVLGGWMNGEIEDETMDVWVVQMMDSWMIWIPVWFDG